MPYTGIKIENHIFKKHCSRNILTALLMFVFLFIFTENTAYSSFFNNKKNYSMKIIKRAYTKIPRYGASLAASQDGHVYIIGNSFVTQSKNYDLIEIYDLIILLVRL